MAPTNSGTSPSPAPPQSGVLLLPGFRFFVRRVNLVADSAVPAQVELALETMAPFPLEQLYFGYIVDEAQRHALVYATYRRNFSAEEQAGWVGAQAILPDFLIWTVARRPQPGASALQWNDDRSYATIGWDGTSDLPAMVLCHPKTDEPETGLLAEAARRTGVPTHQIRSAQGRITANHLTREGLELACGSTTGLLPANALAAADVRDKQVLALQQRVATRNRIMLRVFRTAIAALAACLLLELGLTASNLVLSSRKRELSIRTPEINRIESAQNLASRLEKLSAEQLRPFEMLAAINNPRPASVAFLRVSTTGPLQLEVEAQTTSASDMRNYETALRKLDGVQTVELRDPRMREGRTSFSLAVTFKSGWLGKGGGA